MEFNRFNPMKVLRHYDDLKELGRGNICSPKQFVVYPSHMCNLKCGHCIMTDIRNAGGDYLHKSVLDKVVKDVARLGIDTVRFTGGGEPLTNPHLISTMEQLKSIGVKIALDTNGLKLPNTLPVDYLRISVDAASKETYQKVKGVNGWDKLNAKLKEFQPMGEMGLAFLVTEENYNEVKDFCEWAQQFPYTFLHIRPAYIPERDTSIRSAMDTVIAWKDYLVHQYKNVNIISDKFDSVWKKRKYNKCRATSLKAVLCADGSFIQCQDKFAKFGDYKTQSFEEIWYSDEHRAIIENNDLNTCPRCVEGQTNEIIEHCVMADGLKMGLF